MGGAVMKRDKCLDPIPLTPVTGASREWTLRLLRRCALAVLTLLLVLLALNALAASMGYGSF